MKQGQHPNSRKALEENRKKGQFSGERAVEMQKRSIESHRVKKGLADEMLRQASEVLGTTKSGEDITREMQMVRKSVIEPALDGDLRAMEFYAKMTGQMPNEKHDVHVEGIFGGSGEILVGFSDDADDDENE